MKNFKNSKDFFDVALRYLLKPYLPTAASTFRTYNQNATAKFNEFMDPEYPRPTKAEKAHDEKKDENAGIGLCDQLQPHVVESALDIAIAQRFEDKKGRERRTFHYFTASWAD